MNGTAPGMRPYGWSFALVLFDGRTQIGYLRMLRRGYRHCFAVVQTADGWVLVNPLSNFTEVATLPKLRPDALLAAFAADGIEAVPAQRARPIRRAHPWMPYSCVEAVKRVLGLRAPGVLTPWQLRKRLARYAIRHPGLVPGSTLKHRT